MALVGLAAGLDFRTIVGYVDSEPQFSTLAGLLRDTRLDLVLQAPGGRITCLACDGPLLPRYSTMASNTENCYKAASRRRCGLSTAALFLFW